MTQKNVKGYQAYEDDGSAHVIVTAPASVRNYVWDTGSLDWVVQTASAGGPGSDVNVLNFPASQAVNDGGSSLTIDGSVSIVGTVPVSGPLTDAQLRAVAVPVSGTFWQATQPVSGPLTDTQLRASAVPVSLASVPSHPVTNAGTFAVQVTSAPTTAVTDGGGSLTVDGTVAVSGSVAVTGTFWQATQPVSGPLTDTQLRATAVPVSGTLTDGGAGKTLKSASFSLSATGTIVAAVPTKRIKVYAYKIVCSAAISVNFRDGGSTALEGAQSMAANGGAVEGVNPPAFLFGTSAGNSLDLVITGTGTAAGRISYWDDDGT